MSLPDNAVVRFDYNLWVEGSDKLAETSMEDAAKEAGIHQDGRPYRPLTVALGHKRIIAGLEDHIKAHAELDKAVTVDLSAEEAYGPRDPKAIQDVPMAQFKKQKVEPKVGLELNMGGRRGIITRVTGGRVRIDLNHELAGKGLRYEYILREVVDSDEDKVRAVLDSFFVQGGYQTELTDETLTIELPMQVNFDQNWAQGKFRVLEELRTLVPGRNIKFVETWPNMPPLPEGDEVLSAGAAGEEE